MCHKFWNLSKTGWSVLDVSSLPKKTKLPEGVPRAPSAHRLAWWPLSGTSVHFLLLAKEMCSLIETSGCDLTEGSHSSFWLLVAVPDWWILLIEESRKKGCFKNLEGWYCCGIHIFHFLSLWEIIFLVVSTMEFKLHLEIALKEISHTKGKLDSFCFLKIWSTFF